MEAKLFSKNPNPHPTVFSRCRVLSQRERWNKLGSQSDGDTKLHGVGVGRMKEESGGRSVEEAAYGCRKSTAGGSISI